MNLSNTTPENVIWVIFGSLLLGILGFAGTVTVAKITAKYTRKSSEESNSIAAKNVDIEERKVAFDELKTLMLELKESVKNQREEIKTQREELASQRERIEANERDINSMKFRHSKLLDYLRQVLAIIDRHNLRSEIPTIPEDLDLYHLHAPYNNDAPKP